jgi:hypothetical protein
MVDAKFNIQESLHHTGIHKHVLCRRQNLLDYRLVMFLVLLVQLNLMRSVEPSL